MSDGARDLADPAIAPLRADRLAVTLAEQQVRRESQHEATMRTISRRFWLTLALLVASAIIGWGVAKGLLNEPLLAVVGLS